MSLSSQGGVGVPQHPAVAQCPPHVRAGSDQHCSTPTAPHQVLHHHLQVSAHWAQSEYHHSLCDNAPVTQTPVDKLLSSNSRDNASQQFMLNCIADVDLPWVYNNTISDVNLCLQEYGEYRLWKDPGVCVWDNQAPNFCLTQVRSQKVYETIYSGLHPCSYIESWCSCGKCKFESRLHHFIIQFPFIIYFFSCHLSIILSISGSHIKD